MPCLQQEMVITRNDLTGTGIIFMGMEVYTSENFSYKTPKKFFSRTRNKRLIKKWIKRYGYITVPRKDADIYPNFILCHPNTLWRFNPENFKEPEGAIIEENEYDIHL